MKDVMLSFGKGLDGYLTKDQIRNSSPLVFADAPTNPDVSKKYLFVNTETIIDDLEKLGWLPVQAAQRKSRKEGGTIFSKHMVAFQNPEIKITSADGDDAYPRILLTNSHDGMQAFKFSVGIFRLVCSNGLVVADEQFSDFKIKHKGYTFGELRNVVRQAVEDLPNRVQVMNDMKNRILTEDEKRKMALDAMLIRAGVKELQYDEETITDILDPKRDADKGDDLWRVFNVIQEKITQGDFHAALTGAKVRKVRKIKSFEKDMKVNKELFKLATALV
ncbi:MAG: DUF932 domain-containing protein [Euryarchaeota archaeon]|nr:DUF932 domain-containing protein [Euryarchaeota archaeon]